MKNMRVLAGLLFVVLCSFAPAEWVPFENKEGGFKLLFPRQPEATEQTAETAIGPIAMKMFFYEVDKYKDENALYGMIYADYPDSLVHSDMKDEIIDKIFDGSIKGMEGNMKAKVLSQSRIKYKEYPGRRVKMNVTEAKSFLYVQVYLVKNRMYILEVGCDKTKDNNLSIDKFFKSFALL